MAANASRQAIRDLLRRVEQTPEHYGIRYGENGVSYSSKINRNLSQSMIPKNELSGVNASGNFFAKIKAKPQFCSATVDFSADVLL
jgi:hypothetical protein